MTVYLGGFPSYYKKYAGITTNTANTMLWFLKQLRLDSQNGENIIVLLGILGSGVVMCALRIPCGINQRGCAANLLEFSLYVLRLMHNPPCRCALATFRVREETHGKSTGHAEFCDKFGFKPVTVNVEHTIHSDPKDRQQ